MAVTHRRKRTCSVCGEIGHDKRTHYPPTATPRMRAALARRNGNDCEVRTGRREMAIAQADWYEIGGDE